MAVATGEPKTIKGRRTIKINEATVAALRSFTAKLARERLAAGECYTDSDLIAVDEIRHPIRPELLGDRFASITRAAGLPRIRLEDLRHTAGATMHLNGVPVRTIAEVLGHADPGFTLRTHIHSTETEDDEAFRALDTIFETRSAG